MKSYDVIIIGAGAAGLMCAITAAGRDKSVLVLERANKIGKKILMSGGGRCNFTNMYAEPSNYLSQNPHFCKSALSRYTQWDFIALVEKHGIAYHEKSQGQLFCDDSSKQILAMLLDEAKQAGVEIQTRCELDKVECEHGFRLETSLGEFHAKSLVVASGGLSIPTLGGSDIGYRIAEQYGMKLLPRRAGLVPFTLSGALKEMSVALSGLSLPARLSCGDANFLEQLLFTHRGLSGPVVLQLSSYWREGEAISIDLLPEADAADLLNKAKNSQAKSLLRTVLNTELPKKLVSELEKIWWPDLADKPLAEFPDKILADIADKLNNWSLTPAGTEGYRTAEVTMGGVDTNDLSSKTMESKTRPDLYFIGEVIDVSGQLGGFNFQWAWASGFVAGESV